MKEKRVKKGEVLKIKPLSEEAKSEIDRSEHEEQAAKISADYLVKRPEPISTLEGKTTTMRERILALSLFPNIYNKHYLETHG